MKTQAVSLSGPTVEKLKSLEVEFGGVKLDTYELKVAHLIWFYQHYKNNNSDR